MSMRDIESGNYLIYIFLCGLGSVLKKYVRSEEIFRVFLIYLMYGQSAVCGKSICLHLENFIAFQTVIQELWTACNDRKWEHARR